MKDDHDAKVDMTQKLLEGLGFSNRKEFLTNEFEQIVSREINLELDC